MTLLNLGLIYMLCWHTFHIFSLLEEQLHISCLIFVLMYYILYSSYTLNEETAELESFNTFIDFFLDYLSKANTTPDQNNNLRRLCREHQQIPELPFTPWPFTYSQRADNLSWNYSPTLEDNCSVVFDRQAPVILSQSVYYVSLLTVSLSIFFPSVLRV